jgi:hypothetical protein
MRPKRADAVKASRLTRNGSFALPFFYCERYPAGRKSSVGASCGNALEWLVAVRCHAGLTSKKAE